MAARTIAASGTAASHSHGLTTAYVYFDARTRFELDALAEPDGLPAEIQLTR
jgi:hypothetical protein